MACSGIRLHEDDTIVEGRLLSETTLYLLTAMGVLIALKHLDYILPKAYIMTAFTNVSKFATSRDRLVMLMSQQRVLYFFEHHSTQPLKGFSNETIAALAETGKISVIDTQFALLYDRSSSILFDFSESHMYPVPVGAEMMHYESPVLLALDGTTFTEYSLKGVALRSCTFKGFVRAIPNADWSLLALYPSQIMDHQGRIQFASRRTQRHDDIILREMYFALPDVLFRMIVSYILDVSLTELSRSKSKTSVTLNFIRDRLMSDVSMSSLRTFATDGTNMAFVAGNSTATGSSLHFCRCDLTGKHDDHGITKD